MFRLSEFALLWLISVDLIYYVWINDCYCWDYTGTSTFGYWDVAYFYYGVGSVFTFGQFTHIFSPALLLIIGQQHS